MFEQFNHIKHTVKTLNCITASPFAKLGLEFQCQKEVNTPVFLMINDISRPLSVVMVTCDTTTVRYD